MSTLELVTNFKRKFKSTIAWRIKKHCQVADNYLNPGEEALFAFAAQKSETPFDISSTAVLVLTNKRLCIAQKRVLFGYSFTAITPDLFNDLNVYSGIIWGKITIDTVKEVVIFKNISKKALDDIETAITERMMREKKKYKERENTKK